MKMGCYHHFKVEETEEQTSHLSKFIRDEVEFEPQESDFELMLLVSQCGRAEI